MFAICLKETKPQKLSKSTKVFARKPHSRPIYTQGRSHSKNHPSSLTKAPNPTIQNQNNMKLAIVAALLAALATISLVVQPGQAVTCPQVVSSIAPCLNYLRGREANPNALCCGGVRAVKGMCQTTADKRTACSCLQRAAAGETDLKDAAAQSLGPKCNVPLDVPISKTVDCSRWVVFVLFLFFTPIYN